MLTLTLKINPNELKFTFISSPGPGGQNVNKVATGVLLRFEVNSPSLSEEIRGRLLLLAKNQITNEGVLLIKATRHRTQERNKQDAINRFNEIITQAAIRPKKRLKTKPTQASKRRRLDSKKLNSQKKALRRV